MRALATIALALCATAISASAQNRQTDDSFTWNGRLAAGATLRIQNLAGKITVQPSTNGQIQVAGRKEWQRGDPADVRFEVVPGTNVVTICAIWYGGGCGDQRGSSDNTDRRENRSNDVSVTFTVALPPGVNLDASGVSADIEVTGASGDIRAQSVSGDVTLADVSGDVQSSSVSGNVNVRGGTVGTINANSVSGDIIVAIDALSGTGDLTFTTVSGDVEATLPGGLGADVQMNTVSGELNSEFPLTVQGDRDERRSIRGRIGTGGRSLRFSTVSGDVVLRQG
jgi:hypothetical protein